MKKNKLILIGILLLLVIIYLVLMAKRPKDKVMPLVSIATEKIEEIELWNDEGKVLLKKEGESWKLFGDLVWDADSVYVERLFDEVLVKTHSTEPVSNTKEAIYNYDLGDDKALHIKVKGAGKSEHLLFGNVGNAWDYVRRDGSFEVYQLMSKVVSDFPPEFSRFRDPKVVHYLEDDLAEIKVKYLSYQYTLSLEGMTWKYHDKNNDFIIDNNNYALVKIISILQHFNSYLFDTSQNEKMIKSFKNPICEVWITDIKGEVKKLSFAQFEEDRYLLVVDDDFAMIHDVGANTVNRFTRGVSIFRDGMM